MINNIFSKKSGGFTLIEILVALSITAVVITLVYTSLNSTRQIMDKIDMQMEGYHTSRRVLSRLQKSLFVYKWERPAVNTNAEENPYVFEAEDALGAQGDETENHRDSLRFTALIRAGTPDGDLKEVSFYTSEPDEKGLFSIYQNWRSKLYIEGVYSGRTYEIAKGVKGFNLKYSDGSQWQEDWSALKKGRVPKLVEVSIVLLDNDNKELSFSDIIRLDRRQPQNN